MNYASTVGGGAMTAVVVRTSEKQARSQKSQAMALRQKSAPARKSRVKVLKKAA